MPTLTPGDLEEMVLRVFKTAGARAGDLPNRDLFKAEMERRAHHPEQWERAVDHCAQQRLIEPAGRVKGYYVLTREGEAKMKLLL